LAGQPSETRGLLVLVALADRYRTTRIVSFDERHFRAVTPLSGGAFTILPADR
jgi:hypothetical protein